MVRPDHRVWPLDAVDVEIVGAGLAVVGEGLAILEAGVAGEAVAVRRGGEELKRVLEV